MKKIITALPEKLADQGFVIEVYEAQDLPETYIGQLVKKSNQPHVSELDKKADGSGRFANEPAYKAWVSKNRRIIYLLLQPARKASGVSDIAGIFWFGEKQNKALDPSYKLTFGVRIYEEYLGTGLSKPFMEVAHAGIEENHPGESIWLETDDDNIPALKAYESLGYHELSRRGSRVIMGYQK